MKTTRESAKERSHEQIVACLQELLEKNYDAAKDYKIAVERADDHELKQFLIKQVVRRDHYATELDKLIHSLNEKPKETGSLSGSIHRTWLNLKNSIGKHTDESLLKECLEGEKNSIENYEEKLSKKAIPTQIEEVLQRQLAEMKVTYASVSTMEDILKN